MVPPAEQLLEMRLGAPHRQRPASRSTRSLVSAPARMVAPVVDFSLVVARTLVAAVVACLAQTLAAAAAAAAAAVGPPDRKRRQAAQDRPLLEKPVDAGPG